MLHDVLGLILILLALSTGGRAYTLKLMAA